MRIALMQRSSREFSEGMNVKLVTQLKSGIGAGNPHRQSNIRKQRLDLEAARFKPLRKLERLAERLCGFVDCKSRRIGCDLEQHTARLAEIHRMEIIAIDYRSDVESERDELR